MIALFIVFAVLIVAGFAVPTFIGKAIMKSEPDSNYYQERGKRVKRLRYIICIPLVLIMLLVGIFSGVRVIDSTEVGVVKTFGRIDHVIDEGLEFTNPLTDTVDMYDLRVHVREAQFASYTKDAQPMTASIEYQFALDPTQVMAVAREFGSQEIMETKLDNVVQEKAKVIFAGDSAMKLLEKRSSLSAAVKEEVKSLEDEYHVHFTQVVVKDLDFSDAFEASVEAKMTAEQDALRAEQEKKTAIIKAEQKQETAKIDAQAEIAKAKGEAEAMQITREALKNMPDAYIQQLWIEKWDGKLPTTQAGDSASVIVNPGVPDAGKPGNGNK